MNEAIVTGVCSVNSRELALGVMSFSFMGGSMGAVVGEKIVRLCSVAVQRQIPLLLFTASGGARMQEGIISLMQMARTSHAAALLEEKGLPFSLSLPIRPQEESRPALRCWVMSSLPSPVP